MADRTTSASGRRRRRCEESAEVQRDALNVALTAAVGQRNLGFIEDTTNVLLSIDAIASSGRGPKLRSGVVKVVVNDSDSAFRARLATMPPHERASLADAYRRNARWGALGAALLFVACVGYVLLNGPSGLLTLPLSVFAAAMVIRSRRRAALAEQPT